MNIIDIGDITWDDLHNPSKSSNYENLLRWFYFKWVYPFADRSHGCRIGHIELEVEDDGFFAMKFVPRFKLTEDDAKALKEKLFLSEQFPPDAEEMKQLAAEKEAQWKADTEKCQREHGTQKIDVSQSAMKRINNGC